MTIEGFDPTITEYDVTLPAGTYGEIRLIAEAESTLADIQADPVTIENGKAEGVITVTAENGTEKTYRIHFRGELIWFHCQRRSDRCVEKHGRQGRCIWF